MEEVRKNDCVPSLTVLAMEKIKNVIKENKDLRDLVSQLLMSKSPRINKSQESPKSIAGLIKGDQNSQLYGLDNNVTGMDKAEKWNGRYPQHRKEPIESLEVPGQTEEKQEENHQVKASASRCPSSCGRDCFFAAHYDICPRRALVDIYLNEALRLIEKSQINNRMKTEDIFDYIRAVCRRLRCRDFLPMMQDREFIASGYQQNISEPKKESFHIALQHGKGLFEKYEECILIYRSKSKDGFVSIHCVEMQFTKNCKVEQIVFIDHQIGKKLVLDDFPVNALESIRMIPTKKLENLKQDCGKNLCMKEDVGKDKNAVVNDILKDLSFKGRGKVRERSVTI